VELWGIGAENKRLYVCVCFNEEGRKVVEWRLQYIVHVSYQNVVTLIGIGESTQVM